MTRYRGYHTALAPAAYGGKSVDLAALKNGLAFRYDIFSMEFPTVYRACDVFYSDLPWRSGFNEFEVRASMSGRSYADFLSAIRGHIKEYSRPVVFVTGKHAVDALCPDRVYKTRLNSAPAMALCWGLELKSPSTEMAILSELASRFERAGDYCCGYGRTGRIFSEAGKEFIMSDHNGRCIGYIRDNFA